MNPLHQLRSLESNKARERMLFRMLRDGHSAAVGLIAAAVGGKAPSSTTDATGIVKLARLLQPKPETRMSKGGRRG